MEGNISGILQHNTACISALHVLKVDAAPVPGHSPDTDSERCYTLESSLGPDVSLALRQRPHTNVKSRNPYELPATCNTQVYAQRLGCDLNRPAAVSRTLGDAFLLVSEALADPGMLQFSPSVTAAAVLVAARKAQVRAGPRLALRDEPSSSCVQFRTEDLPRFRTRRPAWRPKGQDAVRLPHRRALVSGAFHVSVHTVRVGLA